VWSAAPENTAVEGHYYSAERPDGTMDTRIEEHLAKMEGLAAPAYEALLRYNVPKDSQARADFATFLALMHVRTPAMRAWRLRYTVRGSSPYSMRTLSNRRIFRKHDETFEKEWASR